ncbi:MAG: ABC transporter substrate-binding protein [Dehalococcoidales bacterium]|nr:ABC transporter substrate-binding protein [Dehalococcoidales bacterium]
MQSDWASGPAGSGEWDGLYPDILPADQERGMVAERWEVTDPNTMVIHIRQGVHFQNKAPAFGREVTAYDVEFSLLQGWTVPTAYAARNYLVSEHFVNGSAVEGIKATDKWTIVIKAQPGKLGSVYEIATTYFSNVIVPPEWLKYDMNDWRNAGGTGAFMVTDYVAASSITYQRNPDYWGKDPLFPENQLPYLDGFKELIIPDASTRMAAMRTGKLDILSGNSVAAGAFAWEDAIQLRKSSPELQSRNFVGVAQTLFMRVDKPELPWNDVRVRRALNMAIDKQAIKEDLFGGHAEIFVYPVLESLKATADLWIPLEQYPEVARKLFEYHPEEARQLMKDAGYPNGFKAEIITRAPDVDMLSIVANYWKKNLNVDMEIKVVEPGVWTNYELNFKNKPNMLMGSVSPSSPMKLISVRPGRQDRNSSVITDPYVEEVFFKAMANYFDPPARAKVLREFFPYIWEHAWFIQFPAPEFSIFWQPWVKNYYGVIYTGYYLGGPGRQDVPKYIWLDRDMKQAMTGGR